MNRLLVFLGCGAMVLAPLTGTGFAQDLTGKLGAGVRVSYFDIIDDDIDGTDTDYDGTALFEANLTYFLANYFSLELGVGYAKADMGLRFPGGKVDAGELTQVPVLLTGRYHIPTNTMASPYLGAGFGYYFNDFDLSSTLAAQLPAGTTLKVDDSFGFHVNAGMEIFFSERAALNLDAKYVWNKTDFDEDQPGKPTDTSDADLNAFVVGVGLKYYFR